MHICVSDCTPVYSYHSQHTYCCSLPCLLLQAAGLRAALEELYVTKISGEGLAVLQRGLAEQRALLTAAAVQVGLFQSNMIMLCVPY